MSKEALAAFLKKIQMDPTLQQELAAFAAQRGYEFSPDQLGETDLDSVVGGITYVGTDGEAKDKDHEGWTDVLSIARNPGPDPLP